ncbi:hypothetical protein Goklo_016010 [Gossypium klotzschianum]|uniref:Uncharacterized protein n=1 Tax=Gossypium klotzschianum TaxID=34286 RepID=A0A7J8UCY0_9ROSI|nr:hypothetical protein [Gossypium klotzschianum]
MASSMAIKTLAASPLRRPPLTKSLSSLVRLVSFSTKSDDDDDAIPTAGISRPLADILKELNKKVPDSLVRLRTEDGFNIKYIPWHIVNRIMNLHAPGMVKMELFWLEEFHFLWLTEILTKIL